MGNWYDGQDPQEWAEEFERRKAQVMSCKDPLGALIVPELAPTFVIDPIIRSEDGLPNVVKDDPELGPDFCNKAEDGQHLFAGVANRLVKLEECIWCFKKREAKL